MGVRAEKPRWRAVAALVIATLGGALLVTALPAGSAAADRDCSDFANQAQAQRFFESHHPGRDPHYLDGDGDGKACEELPCPCAGSGGGHGGGGGGGGHDGGRSGKARVVSVIDGDTIAVRVRHRSRSVRLVGIDTPEVYGHVECGGRQASRSMKHMLDRGDRVRLVRDRSQSGHDRYGRLLRYVERRGRDVGRRQVRKGWARVYVYDRPFKRVRSYRKAKRRAKRGERGVWGKCGGRFRAPAR